ncbi:hypothetical protein NHX12_000977 [Muraenolepis orangiensis]|uniref:Zinc finger-containing ubiquitin peptidase 1 n=1 Tax=Muraenolepis orangiensis TaxID=630683 RepID=A0A9Q0E3N0_9TELE|nr:hypothetical protein NHX12_000977 [Muraenolepis orangiensis]
MLTCELCGEELLLEEDMRTHLQLSHLESPVSCPLCGLSGVSYDELTHHVHTAHPDDLQVKAQEQDSAGNDSSSAHPGTRHAHSTAPPAHPRAPWSGGGGFPAGAESDTTITESTESTGDAIPTSSSFCGRGTSSHQTNGTFRPDTSTRALGCGGSDDEARGGQYPCPMCSLSCRSSRLLREHVEVHLQVEDSPKVVCDDDLSLLQHVEEHFSGTAKDGAEAVDFKKLKEQFGVDGAGGYRRQIERRMEKAVGRGLMTPAEYHSKRANMMESLASGLDDGTTRTQGTLGALCEYYQKEPRGCVHVWLSAETDHYNSSEGDKGWGCGYRNLQMLLSALRTIQAFTDCLPERGVPSVPQLQRMIEGAWREGMDPEGAAHFNHRLQGTRAWIGATEIYAVLTSLGLRASITDFHKPTGPGDTHPRMLEWVKQYFARSSSGGRLPPRVVQTALPPLYLQHQGHSRSIVGVEERKDGGLCLLVLDPACGLATARKLLSADVRHLRRFPSNMKHRQYQVVAVDQVLSPEEKQVRILSSRTLRVERIP